MATVPCKHCADRAVGCHGLCEAYNTWALEHKEAAKWARDARVVIHKSDFTGTSPRPGNHRRTRRLV